MAVSSTVSDFLQHILWWPRCARFGAPVLLLRLTQKHPCLAHLPVLFCLTEKCNQGFWGRGRCGAHWASLATAFLPSQTSTPTSHTSERLLPHKGRHLLCRSITCTSVPFSKTASSGRSVSSLPFFVLSASCPLSFLI